MAIIECKTQAEVDAINEPKSVWHDLGRIVVRTGDDIPKEGLSQRVITASQFRARFTGAELDAIMALAYAGDNVARRLLLKVQTADGGIALDSPEVVGGIDYLIVKKALAADRKPTILA